MRQRVVSEERHPMLAVVAANANDLLGESIIGRLGGAVNTYGSPASFFAVSPIVWSPVAKTKRDPAPEATADAVARPKRSSTY